MGKLREKYTIYMFFSQHSYWYDREYERSSLFVCDIQLDKVVNQTIQITCFLNEKDYCVDCLHTTCNTNRKIFPKKSQPISVVVLLINLVYNC